MHHGFIMKQQKNGSRLEESAAALQHAMATLLQNQASFVQNQATLGARIDGLGVRIDTLAARIDTLSDKMDRKFGEVDSRLEHIESLLARMFAELPEKVFGFVQAKKEAGNSGREPRLSRWVPCFRGSRARTTNRRRHPKACRSDEIRGAARAFAVPCGASLPLQTAAKAWHPAADARSTRKPEYQSRFARPVVLFQAEHRVEDHLEFRRNQLHLKLEVVERLQNLVMC